MTPAPKKYIKMNGVMKMNPAYKKWKDASSGAMPVASAVPANPHALAVVSNMDDHMKLNEDLGTNVALAESTDATIEMMQEPEICLAAGMQPDEMVDQLGAILGKYEVPMGLMNKRKLSISVDRKIIDEWMDSWRCQNSTLVTVDYISSQLINTLILTLFFSLFFNTDSHDVERICQPGIYYR